MSVNAWPVHGAGARLQAAPICANTSSLQLLLRKPIAPSATLREHSGRTCLQHPRPARQRRDAASTMRMLADYGQRVALNMCQHNVDMH